MKTQTATATPTPNDLSEPFPPTPRPESHLCLQIREQLARVASTISPVWPLRDYVAVNPYAGIAERSFLDARSFLKVFSECETLMPMDHYAGLFRRGELGMNEIAAAVEEMTCAEIGRGRLPTTQVIVERLCQVADPTEKSGGTKGTVNSDRHLFTMSEYIDRHGELGWTEAITDEISKHCSAHYDRGQAAWPSPWKSRSLFEAWRSAAVYDRHLEALGLAGFRRFVAALPHTPEAAMIHLMGRLGVPVALWETVLLCQAFSIPGWCAWAKYLDQRDDQVATEHLSGLLAIRLAHDVALGEFFDFEIDWSALGDPLFARFPVPSTGPDDDALMRYVLLRATEIRHRDGLLASIASTENDAEEPQVARKLAQIVFCIDVRSERIRRHLESTSPEVETFGFAGFFGMPIEHVELGQQRGDSHVPALLRPQFRVFEGLVPAAADRQAEALKTRTRQHRWKRLWKSLSSSSIGCFPFVESTGLWFGVKLLFRGLCEFSSQWINPRALLGVSERWPLAPTRSGLDGQGVTIARQADLAEKMLRSLGLTAGLARLVVLCGHASETDNNPLSASLDCGACGGHSGEPNARFAALLLNDDAIREVLRERGLVIPSDTCFLAGLHTTTNDEIRFFDLDQVPESHRKDVTELIDCATVASDRTRHERMPFLASRSPADLFRRASDWSEVRPEWGLAGNASFIAAPRSLTRSINLDGRTFLHSYDCKHDPEGKILETIMTAPMIVAHWINMQYYASTVDHRHFGSGNKTLHNVVGRFGILSGNGGDLKTGLPWQSLHRGDAWGHSPLRLQAVIAAPQQAIERVIEKHQMVGDLITGGWLHLVAFDENGCSRFAENRSWQRLSPAGILGAPNQTSRNHVGHAEIE